MQNVSVVVPTFNRAHSLPLTLKSVFGQTYPAFEVIIVDDGSVDDTERICLDVAPGARYVCQANAGCAAARNRGIAEARGDWIALIDSDDVWEANKLEVQLAVLKRVPELRWCTTNCRVVDPAGESVEGQQGFRRVFSAFEFINVEPEAYFARWLSRDEVIVNHEQHAFFHGDFFELLFHGNIVLPSSAIIHRDVFENCGLFDTTFRFAEETEFFHRISAQAPGGVLMSQLVRYRAAGSDSMTNPNNTPLFVRGALASLERIRALRGELSTSEFTAYEQARRRLLWKLAYAELSILNRSAARDALRAGWGSGAGCDLRSCGLYATSLLPVPILRKLHRLKRGFAARHT